MLKAPLTKRKKQHKDMVW